jgi:hypothetical protein
LTVRSPPIAIGPEAAAVITWVSLIEISPQIQGWLLGSMLQALCDGVIS